MKHTLTVNVREISALEFRHKCGASVTFPLTKQLPERIGCPACGQTIIEADLSSNRNAELHRLTAALADWNGKADRSCEVTFTLNLD